ncbi:MAG: hypothetical protein U1F68_06860 [Gammaproteobacteria bacterium]
MFAFAKRLSLHGAVLSTALVGLMFALASANIWADENAVTFTLTNGTEATLTEFYASPPDTDDWEDDILGVEVLKPGESVKITINDGREDCHYDFKAVFKDGTTQEHDAVKICDGESYIYQ